MSKFTYNDIVSVRVNDGADSPRKAWVVGIFEKRPQQGTYFDKFPPGVVYTVEFEDGSSTQFHEDDLQLWD
ncbi:hypothetical protein [Dyella choica]|uniref:Uncharacterized protein n=1 Tax=Dyella choica TaxID=1927959 RepID=A0A3S0R5D4_9GAMM|nr:hypothetical protein [Dyella choica]RUL78263.1 hypothetical protein EKH80_05385 [Dyella choica]